ncbi:hypothetical protein PILCRDRAFT_13238 [Piloderma croceum F 1598]|uniref:Uncharacterized protein n=1 Tax=Piloderma croceum (strain F 1598) TaxID=765440 RepID=A0A0C3F7H3_PILCF|nr:hypothetical protein PILCRDRAFT_13238 [Piloderma croceum F 1598]
MARLSLPALPRSMPLPPRLLTVAPAPPDENESGLVAEKWPCAAGNVFRGLGNGYPRLRRMEDSESEQGRWLSDPDVASEAIVNSKVDIEALLGGSCRAGSIDSAKNEVGRFSWFVSVSFSNSTALLSSNDIRLIFLMGFIHAIFNANFDLIHDLHSFLSQLGRMASRRLRTLGVQVNIEEGAKFVNSLLVLR